MLSVCLECPVTSAAPVTSDVTTNRVGSIPKSCVGWPCGGLIVLRCDII